MNGVLLPYEYYLDRQKEGFGRGFGYYDIRKGDGGGAFELAKEDECASGSAQTCLSRLEPQPPRGGGGSVPNQRWRSRSPSPATVLTMSPAGGLVRNLANRVQKLKKRRRSSRFSLMESRESTSSLKSYYEVRKKVLPSPFAQEDPKAPPELSVVSSLQLPEKKQRIGERLPSPQPQPDTLSFPKSPSPHTSESSFGTKLTNLLQEQELQMKELKQRQKQQLQILLENLSRKNLQTPEKLEKSCKSDSLPVSLGRESQPGSQPEIVFDPVDAYLNIEEDIGLEEQINDVQAQTTPPEQVTDNTRKTPRRTGNGRRWHGYDPAAKAWWMV